MEKIITVGGQNIRFKASAATVRNYRTAFNRDLLRDMAQVTKHAQEGEMSGSDLEIFENFAFICRREADPDNTPDTPAEWLEQFDMMDLYNILPELVILWAGNNKTLEEPKKKADQLSGH